MTWEWLMFYLDDTTALEMFLYLFTLNSDAIAHRHLAQQPAPCTHDQSHGRQPQRRREGLGAVPDHRRLGERGNGWGGVFYGSCGSMLPGGSPQGGGGSGGVRCGGRSWPCGGCRPLVHAGADERIGLQHQPVIGLHAPLLSKFRPDDFEHAGVVGVQPVTLSSSNRELLHKKSRLNHCIWNNLDYQ